ncbi:hypothetical protein [Flavobacterium sp.]|uniref:hypothetical protein n=1 Tax=Flavobacterium sp. TaxID=239 RepID=UPI0035AF5772
MKQIFISIFLCSFLFSCTSIENLEPMENATNLTPKDSIKNEISILIGKTILDKNARKEFLEITSNITDNRNSISLAALLNSTENLSIHEKRMITSKYQNKSIPTSFFKEKFNSILNTEKKNTPAINNLKEKNSITSKGVSSLLNILAKENLEIVVPYLEDFDMDSNKEISVTYDPEVRDDWNFGNKFEFNDNGEIVSGKQVVINDDYAYQNNTLFVRSIPDYVLEDKVYVSPVPKVATSITSTDPYITPGSQFWLTQNVDHTKISEKDVLLVTIPKIKMNGHLGNMFTSNLISIVRGSGDIAINSDPNSGFLANSHDVISYFEISKHNARKKNWVELNATFDGDWDVHEASQQIVFMNHKRNAYNDEDSKLSATVAIGYDKTTNTITYDPKFNLEWKMTSKKNSKIRFHSELSRKDVLSHLFGDFFGNGVQTEESKDKPYSIRSAGMFQYYFKVHLTKID